MIILANNKATSQFFNIMRKHHWYYQISQKYIRIGLLSIVAKKISCRVVCLSDYNKKLREKVGQIISLLLYWERSCFRRAITLAGKLQKAEQNKRMNIEENRITTVNNYKTVFQDFRPLDLDWTLISLNFQYEIGKYFYINLYKCILLIYFFVSVKPKKEVTGEHPP